ncbi:MAG TPA: DUF952 domain-containing protein, partial [Dehalococcoidia bacterium]|nr:DUF952 domain-containing protein [Dehalococcoidia bacterium]
MVDKLAHVADGTIYHIAGREAWAEAQAAGEYRADSLAEQGFIHASTAPQVIETADRFYRGQDGLVLLCIDASRVRAEIRYEAASAEGHSKDAGLFPHLYGPLNVEAVARAVAFPCRADGTFEMPWSLREPESRRDPITQATQMTEETAQKLLRFIESSEPVRRIRASQLLTGVLGAVGFALFVVGVEQAAQDIPIISNAYGSIAVGVVLLAATGLLLRRLAGGGE